MRTTATMVAMMTTETMVGTPDPDPTPARVHRQPTVDDLLDLRSTLSNCIAASESHAVKRGYMNAIEHLDNLIASL